MPLPLLLLLVVVGVSLVVWIVHLAGGSRNQAFSNEDEVEARFLMDFPDFDVEKTILSSDSKLAILVNADPAVVGLVVRMGAHSITRLLDANYLNSVTKSNKGLVLGLKDMTLPTVDIILPNGSNFEEIERRLKKIIYPERS